LRSTLGGALGFALLLAACTSTPPPTPPPATPAPSVWDARKDAIDQHAGLWALHQPAAYAYTLDHEGATGDDPPYGYRVSGLEGAVQVQHLGGPVVPDSGTTALTVDGLFQRARDALATPAFQIAFDARTGMPTSLTFASPSDPSAAGARERLDDLHTPADQGEVARAQAALAQLLQRSRGLDDDRWAYTWSRIPAGQSTAQPVTWTVSRSKGKTTAKPVAAGNPGVTADDVSIEGTVLAVQNVLVSGGWADVALEDDPGRGVLIAVDPSPAVKGDAYWIRIAWTDLARQASISDLDAAKARWATAQLTDYSYTWQYRGDGDPLTYKVSRKGENATITPVGATPAPETHAYAVPRIEDTFAMIQAVLDQGGSVTVTYDDQLGYPVRVEMHPNGDAGANGVITIRQLKRR
jgi:hypothetical protein